MEREDLLAFLQHVRVPSLEGYLRMYGDEPLVALEERLAWAAWNFRAAEKQIEARFLMEHHEALRAVLREGETAWHLRLKRAERQAKQAVAAPSGAERAAGMPMAGAPPPRRPGATPPPAPPGLGPPPTPAISTVKPLAPPPSVVRTLSPRPATPAPAAPRQGATPPTAPPRRAPTPPTAPPRRREGSPSLAKTLVPHRRSEADTLMQDAPDARLPTGLDRTLIDLDPNARMTGPLSLAKTGTDEADDGPLAGISRRSLAPARPRSEIPPPRDRGVLLALAVGLVIAGLGALALAAVILAEGRAPAVPEPIAPSAAPAEPVAPAEPPVEPVVEPVVAPPPPEPKPVAAPRPAPRAAPVTAAPSAPTPASAPPQPAPPQPVSTPPAAPPARAPSVVSGTDLRGNWVGTAGVGTLFFKLDWQRDQAVAGRAVLDFGGGKQEFDVRGSWVEGERTIFLREAGYGDLVFEGTVDGDTARGTWQYRTETSQRSWFVVKQ